MERNVFCQQLLEAGVHFGHLQKKWNPKMEPYIFGKKKKIHIIDLHKTITALETAAAVLKNIAKQGNKILFVATKKQAREIITNLAKSVDMPYVTERWLGGMLTNFSTIRKSIKKMQNIEKMLSDGTLDEFTKKERLTLERDKNKTELVLGGVAKLKKMPSAIFLVDIEHESIALAEARRLGILTLGIVDTNVDPNLVDYPIPCNDDATKSIAVVSEFLVKAIAEGLEERKAENGGDIDDLHTDHLDDDDKKAASLEVDDDEHTRKKIVHNKAAGFAGNTNVAGKSNTSKPGASRGSFKR